MVQHVLMIEDDERLAGMVAAYLAPHGYAVRHAATARAGIAMLQQGGDGYALVLLDLMLPDADGLDVCRQIRALAAPLRAIPVVMLTAKGDPFDRVVGLEIGADDYLPKPFEPRELLARLRAVLRRPPLADDTPRQVLHFGRLEIDLGARASPASHARSACARMATRSRCSSAGRRTGAPWPSGSACAK